MTTESAGHAKIDGPAQMMTRHEDARLRALSRYTDWDSGRAVLDDLARLGALVCGTPFADIALVGADTVWLQAESGWGAKGRIDRRHAFARFVVERIDRVVIPDALADPDYCTSPYVTGPPHIRFAAGVPILVQGHAIGTLCVFDKVVRDLSREAFLALEALARQCVSHLELHRSLRLERESEERLRLIFESATDYAIMTLDEAGTIESWNTGASQMFGWTRDEAVGRPLAMVFTAADGQAGVPGADLAKAADQGHEIDGRTYQRKNHSQFWGTGKIMPLLTKGGAPRGYLKILRDQTSQKRIREALEYQSGILQAITDHLTEALIQVDIDHRVTFMNPAAEEMFGWSRFELFGVNLHDRLHVHHRDGSDGSRAACPYVVALKSRATLQRRSDVFRYRDGRLVDVVVSFTPIVSDGVLTGAVMTVVDVTEARKVEEDLRRTQERYQLAVTASDIVGTWDWNLRTRKVVADQNFAGQYGIDPLEAQLGAPLEAFQAAIHPDDRQRVFDGINASIASREQFVAEYRLRRADGSVRWVAAHARCHYDQDGSPIRYPGLSVDITERKRGEERRVALLDLEDQLRNEENPAQIPAFTGEILCRLLDAKRAGFCELDATGQYGTIERDFVVAGFRSLVGTYRVVDFGASGDELLQGHLIAIADVALDARMASQRERWAALNIAAVVNAPLVAEGRTAAVIFVHDDRPHAWTADDIALIRNVADRTWAAIARARGAAQQTLLTGELHHRLKNTMTMVLAIANQTMRKAATKEEAFLAFEARMLALSDAQDVLTRSSWAAAPILRIVEGTLVPHRPQTGDRFRIEGPAVDLSAQTALSFALAFHELATNATKYGALSNETGTVAIVWTIDDDDGQPRFRLVWEECGGPPVTVPMHKGFGSRLIKGSFARTITITMDFAPTGLRCSFEAPLGAL